MGTRRPYSTPEADAGWNSEPGFKEKDGLGLNMDQVTDDAGNVYRDGKCIGMLNANGDIVDPETGFPIR